MRSHSISVIVPLLILCFFASDTQAFQYIRFPQHQQIQYVDPFYSSPLMYASSGPSFVSPLHAHLARAPSVDHWLAQLDYLDQVEQLQRDTQLQMARMQQQMKEQQALVDRMLARVHAQQQPHLLRSEQFQQPQPQQAQPRQNWFQTIAQQQQQLLQQQFPQLFGRSQQSAPQAASVPQPKQPGLVEQQQPNLVETPQPQEIKQNPQREPLPQQQQQPQQSTYVLVRNADGSLAVKRVASPAPQLKQEQAKTQPIAQQPVTQEGKQIQQPTVETKQTQPEAVVPASTPAPAVSAAAKPSVQVPAPSSTSEPVDVNADEEIVPELMVTTTPDYYDVRLTFPPISSEYIHAEIRANQLVLTGERHYEDKVVLRPEEVGRIGQYGFVRRKWKLPQGVANVVDIQNIPAEFNQQSNTLTLRLFKAKAIDAGRVPTDVIGPNTKTKAVGSTIYIPVKITGEPVKREKKILPPSTEELELLEDETLFHHVAAEGVTAEVNNQTQSIAAETDASIARTAAGAATTLSV